MAKLKLSGAAVLLLIVVPVFMYGGALLIGIQLGRALERRSDSVTVSFSFRGALAYVAKELWDTNNVFGRRIRGRNERVAPVWLPIPASRVRDESSSDNLLDETISAVEGQYGSSSSSNSATTTSPKKAPPQAQRFHSNQPKRRGSSPSSADDMALEIKTTPRSKTKRYHISNDTSPGGLIRVGPWGGSGGQPFYMHGSSIPRLRTIALHHSSSGVHSLACDYYYSSLAAAGDDDGIRTDGPWGRSYSFDYTPLSRTSIELSAGEHLTAVEGTTGHFSNVAGAVVTSLAFRTSTGRTYGPYGNTAATTTAFSLPAADGACIVGFWGRSGWLLDAIGVYIKPCFSSNSPAYNTTRRARQG